MKPNIVVLMTDDQTFDTIHLLGNEHIITPNLDSLVLDGTSFSNCHIPSGTCGAVCMPSRAMFNTGQQHFHLENSGQSIRDDQPLIGETLKNNGYETFFTGKWHNGVDGFNRSFTSGDNIFFGGMWDHYNVPTNHYDPSGEYDNKVDFVVNFFQSGDVLTMRCNKYNPGKHSTDVVSDSAIEFLSNYQDERPFYLNAAFLAPHDPRVVPQKYLDLYEDVDISLPDNIMDKHPFYFGWERERDEQIAPDILTDEYLIKETKSYYAMITHIDDQVGRIVSKLKERGLYEETIIIFTSDNGLSMGSHGLMGKQNMYDKSIRVPLIVTGPGVVKNNVVDDYLYLFDVFPTIVDILNVDVEGLDGDSFKSALYGQQFKSRDVLYFAFTDLIRAVKTKEFKLIEYRPRGIGEHKYQLFNLEEDPLELHDLMGSDKYKETFNELSVILYEQKKLWEPEDNEFTIAFWERELRINGQN